MSVSASIDIVLDSSNELSTLIIINSLFEWWLSFDDLGNAPCLSVGDIDDYGQQFETLSDE